MKTKNYKITALTGLTLFLTQPLFNKYELIMGTIGLTLLLHSYTLFTENDPRIQKLYKKTTTLLLIYLGTLTLYFITPMKNHILTPNWLIINTLILPLLTYTTILTQKQLDLIYKHTKIKTFKHIKPILTITTLTIPLVIGLIGIPLLMTMYTIGTLKLPPEIQINPTNQQPPTLTQKDKQHLKLTIIYSTILLITGILLHIHT